MGPTPSDAGSGGPDTPEVAPVQHVYVHAPFCARRCFYCDFAVTVNRHGGCEPWASALAQELRLLAEDGTEGRDGAPGPTLLSSAITTLFVGGGTPSLLGPEAMSRLRDVLGESRLAHPDLEWTAEANPESLTPELLSAWRAAGLNRLSLGIQSFQEPVLRWMGRLHGAAGARTAVGSAREHGIPNLSVDLIFGLPSALNRDWSADLETVLELDVPHVSLYGLTAEPGTPLGRQVAEGRVRMPDDAAYEAEYLEAHEVLTSAGYRHYEVSNFARPGFEGRHNAAYWSGAPYLGLGNGAHSYLPPRRRWNQRDWAEYLDALDAGRIPVTEEERLRPDQVELERIWLGLRTDQGIEMDSLPGEDRARVRRQWVPAGLASEAEGRVRLRARGWLLLDDLAVQLSGSPGPQGRAVGGPDNAAPPLTSGLAPSTDTGGEAGSEDAAAPSPPG